jgi:hypothetical protein
MSAVDASIHGSSRGRLVRTNKARCGGHSDTGSIRTGFSGPAPRLREPQHRHCGQNGHKGYLLRKITAQRLASNITALGTYCSTDSRLDCGPSSFRAMEITLSVSSQIR